MREPAERGTPRTRLTLALCGNMLREGSHAPCRRRRQFGGFNANRQRVTGSCVRVCRGHPTLSCWSGAACRFTNQSPLQPGWAALFQSGRCVPGGHHLPAVGPGCRGGGEPFAADSGAGRWSALNTPHSVKLKSLCRLMAPSMSQLPALGTRISHKDCQVIPFQPVSQPD